MMGNAILHDIIKAHLVYNAERLFKFCAAQPQLKQSRIFLPNPAHIFTDARQEWFVDGIKYPADAVWRFTSAYNCNHFPSYYIIHEIKTGSYDLITEMDKHYIHHNHVQLYLWGYPEAHAKNKKPPYTFVKQLDINSLKRIVIPKTEEILEQWRME